MSDEFKDFLEKQLSKPRESDPEPPKTSRKPKNYIAYFAGIFVAGTGAVFSDGVYPFILLMIAFIFAAFTALAIADDIHNRD